MLCVMAFALQLQSVLVGKVEHLAAPLTLARRTVLNHLRGTGHPAQTVVRPTIPGPSDLAERLRVPIFQSM